MALLVAQYGAKEPDAVALHAFSEAGRLDRFTLYAGDADGVLKGSRLDEVARLELDGVAFDPGKRGLRHVLAEVAEPLQQGPAGLGQEQPLGTPIGRIGTPLDQAGRAQPVEKARQRDRLKVEHFGDFGLLAALEAIEAHEHHPLRSRDAERVRLLIRIST